MKSMEAIQNILIVDDSNTARTIIRQCLEIVGLNEKTFFEAKNGQEALTLLLQQKVDLLVTDLNMPVIDGEMLLKQVKAAPMLSEVRVVVITSANNAAKEQELKKLGANAVLNKPVTPSGVAEVFKSIN